MKGILGVDTVDRTIIDWDNLENKKLEKITEELEQSESMIMKEIDSIIEKYKGYKMQDIDRENMIELLTKLSDIQMGLIKADIAKSSNNSRDIVNSFIKNINATFSKQAEKYGININQNMEMRKNIEAIISKYEEVFQKIEDVFDEAIAEQISRKSDLQLKIISVINSRMENQKEKNRYSINDLEQINYLKNEIENLIQYKNYQILESKLNEFLQINIEDKLNEFDIKEKYLKIEENTCYKVIKECNINIEEMIKQKEETLQNIIITKENSILKLGKTNPIKAFFEKITNKINGSKKYENKVLEPAKAKIYEIEENSLPQIIEKIYNKAEKDIYDIDIKISNIPEIIRKNTLNDTKFIENRIKNAYEFIRHISQKAKVVLPIMNINIEDTIRDVVEKIDKKIIYPKYMSDKEKRYSVIKEYNEETNIA